MEPDFNSYKNAIQTDTPETTLNQLEYMANRAERTADEIERFIARFRGIPSGGDTGRPVAVPSGYEGQITRLNEQLSRIEALSGSLASIG